MKKLELAYEIIKESKKSRALYLESGRDYHKVAAHMYSIFECYAHGLIKWDTARTYWHTSILEYLNLYKDDEELYVMESNRMLVEYEDTLKRFKPALDEYKKVAEAKMISNIVVKKQISESVAKDQSNIYFNKRSLSENAIKDIAHTTEWKKVVESYPNLTANDKDRLRMLTVFENDTFNVTGWSKLNEGPTLDTTQMITTVMSEGPTPTMNPNTIRNAMLANPGGMGNQKPAMVGSIAGGQIGKLAGSAIAGPIGGMVGKAIGSQIGSQVGSNIAMNKANAGKPSVAAPATSIRPMPKPVATEDAPKTSIRPVARPGKSLPGGGYQYPNGAIEEPGGFNPTSSMPRPMPRPANLGAPKAAPATSLRPKPRPAMKSNVGRSEMSPNPGVYDGSTRGFESVQQEGYKTIKSIDKERYDEIPGLEGPFMTLSGKVVYYDPKEGSYYDRDTDMYLSYEEFKELDNDYSGMKNTRNMKEAVEGTYMVQSYDYSEDWASLELYVNGSLVDKWDGYFGANETGNPLAVKFVAMAKKNGVDPVGLKVVDGTDGDEGVFTSSGLKWNSNEAKTKPGHNARAMARAQDIIRKGIEQSQKNVDKKNDEKEKVDESKSYVGRETKDGTWKVFKTGNAVAVAGPFKSAQEAKAWIKKQSMQEQVDEAGTVNEISPATKDSYIRKADDDYSKAQRRYAKAVYRDGGKHYFDPDTPEMEKDAKRIKKRERGLAMATKDFAESNTVSEAVTLDYSRHMRSHGKKPRDPGYSSLWMFTTREYGMPEDEEIFKFQGSFADAKKAAAQWAKSQGAYRFYVME